MKKTLFVAFQVAFFSIAQAESIVQTPSGRVTAGLPVPIVIKLGHPTKDQKIEISSGGQKILSITKPEGVTINKISTRFQGISKEIITTITYKNGLEEQHNNTLDLPFAATVPDDQEIKKSEIGGRVIEFTRRGTEYQTSRKNLGDFGFYIKNAASMKHYVNRVTVGFPTDSGIINVTVLGSPYWFEPLVIFSGDFKEPSILDVASD